MHIIYRDEFFSLKFHASYSLTELVISEENVYLNADQYKSEFKVFLELIDKMGCPDRILVNTTQSNYTIAPDLQDWTNTYVFSKLWQKGMRYLAFYIGTDQIQNLSLQQMMEEEIAQRFKSRFFSQERMAIHWLMGQEKST